MCRRQSGTETSERPMFRFKVRKSGGDALLEINPNLVVPMLIVYTLTRSKQLIPCTSVVIEKHGQGPRELKFRLPDSTDHRVQFATRREREQFAACISFLSNKVTKRVSSQPLRVWMGTWNMGEAPPPDLFSSNQRISEWLRPDENNDIICVCVQECVYKERTGYKDCEDDWFRTVDTVLGPKYIKICGYSLNWIRMVLFIRADHREHVSKVSVKKEAVGIAHVLANKGAVCMMFTFRESKLCFVGCHLNAHQDKVIRRNEDFFEIVNGCSGEGMGWKDFWITNQFHHVFWAGDLNYRIDYDRQKVVELSQQGPEGWNFLYKYDQLQHQMRKETAFIDFNESQPLFQPTYKYARGKNIYPDDEKQRIPSWCDRILWKALSEETVIQEEYTSVQTVMTSDHRPVYSLFRIDARNQFVPDSVADPLSTPASSKTTEIWDKPVSAYLKIRQLAGHDLDSLDPNGFSDPYVVFVSPILQNSYSTNVQVKTLHPQWEVEPELRLNFDELEYIENEYIFLAVYDWDLTSQDDPLGQAHLSLKGLLDGNIHNFCIRALGCGKVAGTLTGSIQYVPR
ncbi:Inositol 5-phosphatase 1 [Diplonema papillatum]|nr:Inositol 5-phosphatase 1 [Diplonema papillatum]